MSKSVKQDTPTFHTKREGASGGTVGSPELY